MERYYNADRTEVGVLISPKFGIGMGDEERLDPYLVAMYDKVVPDYEQAYKYLATKYKWQIWQLRDVPDLILEWVPVGVKFKVDEFDGAETIIYKDQMDDWITA